MRRMKTAITVLLSALLFLTGCSGKTESSSGNLTPDDIFSGGMPDIEGYEIPSAMMEISSQQLVTNIRFGWNLGKSLESCISDLDGNEIPDVTPEEGKTVDETLWGNPPATEKLFQTLVESGINAVRLPITWRDHVNENFDIDKDWLNRVKQVVDYAYNSGMYVIITMYHDGAADEDFGAWLRNAADDYNTAISRYNHLWEQICDKFYTYNERLLYESMNEVEFSSISEDEAYDLLNRINQEFVNTVRNSGRNNARRHLVIAGYDADISKTCDERFIMPEDEVGKLILSLHYYAPLTFCKYSIQDYWGNPSEQAWMQKQIEALRSTFVDRGIPVMITEYGAKGSDTASRVFFCEKLTQLCRSNYIAAFLWDDGSELDRETLKWNTPELIDALIRGSSGRIYTPKKDKEISD